MIRTDDETNDNIGTLAIAGIIVGVLVFLIIICIFIIVCFCCWRQKEKSMHVTCMIYMHI